MTRPGEDQQKLKLSPRTKFKFSVIQYNCFKRRPTVKSVVVKGWCQTSIFLHSALATLDKKIFIVIKCKNHYFLPLFSLKLEHTPPVLVRASKCFNLGRWKWNKNMPHNYEASYISYVVVGQSDCKATAGTLLLNY